MIKLWALCAAYVAIGAGFGWAMWMEIQDAKRR